MLRKKIPGLSPGIFFYALMAFCLGRAEGGNAVGRAESASGVALQLGNELLAEGRWAAARAEGLRAREGAESAIETARANLLIGQAVLRGGGGDSAARDHLEAAWLDTEACPAVRCEAALELGRAAWAAGDRAGAFLPLKYAFQHADNAPLFWRSGAALYFFMKGDKRLRRAEPVLWQALQSSRDAWPLWVWREGRLPATRGPSVLSMPGRWIVRLYRTQISPAIGARCDLEPSCSEYFRQASAAHGLLGFPIMADRFVREPSVVVTKEKPVVMPDGRIRYADPLADHDFWLRRKQ